MRDIKFRAWDGSEMIDGYFKMIKREKTRFDGFYFPEQYTPSLTIQVSPLTVMQYTGLNDKNGVDVYEGDIVSLDDDVVAPITFEDGAFQMITSKTQGRSPASQDRIGRFVVVGNIYENPELLEAEKELPA